MAAYNLTSANTGNTYKVNFDSPPSEEDVNGAIDHFDAPILSKQRLSEEKQVENLLGGVPLNPETNQPAYNPEQDLKTLGTAVNAQKIASLNDQLQAQNLDAQSSPLTSAVAGAGTIPLGIAALGEALAKKTLGEKTFNRAFPQDQANLQAAFEKLNSVAGANPVSAGLGATGLNAAMIASGGVMPGGTILNAGKAVGALARSDLPLAGELALTAGKQALPAAAVNTAIGAGQRALLDEPQTLQSALKDAALGAVLGGDNPEAANQLKTGLKSIPQGIKAAIQTVPTPFSTTQFKAATQALRPANKIGTTWNEEFVGKGLGAVKDLGETDIVNAPKDEAVGAFITASGKTLNKINNAIKQITDNPNATEVDGKPLVHRILQAVANDKTLAERPEEVQSILDDFKIYDRNIPLDEAERLLEQTNAELFGPLYNRTVEGKKIAASDLQIKAQEALAQGLRDQINKSLDSALGETGAGADLKRTYGAVSTMKREAQKRYLVALRQAQNSLPEQLQYSNSAADIIEGLLAVKTGGLSKMITGTARAAVTKAIKDLNTSDSMIRTAFQKTGEGQSGLGGQTFPQALPRPEYTAADVRFAQELRRQRLEGGQNP